MATLKEQSKQEELFTGGHRLCAGCLEVATTVYPYTSWKVPLIHSAFENSAATISGVETAYRALKKRGKIPADKKIKFIAFGGDGGTYDIGLQSLSGALERRHNFLYLCYDNGAYMNTGVQRSSATPFGSATTTSPAGSVVPGKQERRKDLTRIVVAHNVEYAAQGSPHNWSDLSRKTSKAIAVEGPTFLNIISPCPLGWYSKPQDSIQLAKLAVETCYWPLYEVEKGVLKVNYKPKEKKPVAEWLKVQGRFKHLFMPGNESMLEDIQKNIDDEWATLLALDGKHLY